MKNTKVDINNIHSIRTYQAVKFDNKLNTFFVTEQTSQHRAVDITIEAGVGVVLQSETDCIIVPFPNISGIYLNTEHKQLKAKKHKDDISKIPVATNVQKSKQDPIGAKRL